jgi:hypothetical protein
MIIVFIIIVMLGSGGEGIEGPGTSWIGGSTITSGSYSPSGTISSDTISSRQSSGGSGEVTINTGNAAYTYQSYEEYIVLDNRTRNPINITGWQLRNGKDERPYYSGSTLQRFSADVATIPQATLVLSPIGQSVNQDVILQGNERAIVTTGSVGVRSPYVVTSFKENICTGYIEALPDYAFNPGLSQNCPRPANEPGIQNLDRECRKIVENLSSCETPKIGERRPGQDYCPDCFEGKLLSSSCKAYLQEHFSYQGCLIYHRNDPKFEGNTWRIFLGRGWEMWADEYESIELFDRFGQLINYQNY